MKIMLFAALSVMTAAAQVIAPGPGIPVQGMSPALRQYLELTNEQVSTMQRLNVELRRYQSDKARRMSQVYAEIQDEMRKQTLDPMALGLRYVELEGIQRELAAKAKETATEVQKQFTPAQRTRLQALLDVIRSYPLACEAVSLNLITPDPYETSWFNTGSFIGTGTGSGVISSGIMGGCAMPAGIRITDSLTAPAQP
jgi:hypothetical protein